MHQWYALYVFIFLGTLGIVCVCACVCVCVRACNNSLDILNHQIYKKIENFLIDVLQLNCNRPVCQATRPNMAPSKKRKHFSRQPHYINKAIWIRFILNYLNHHSSSTIEKIEICLYKINLEWMYIVYIYIHIPASLHAHASSILALQATCEGNLPVADGFCSQRVFNAQLWCFVWRKSEPSRLFNEFSSFRMWWYFISSLFGY